MKLEATLLLFASVLGTNLALPASKNDEVELVPPKVTHSYGDQPVVDTDLLGGWDSSFGNPFGGFFGSFESAMTRMRQQIHDLLEKFPPLSRSNSTEDLGGLPSIPGFGGIDLGKGNSTSVTKVIDGHKVVINETEYKKEDDFGGAFFKVRVIDVLPNSDEMTTEKESENLEPNIIIKNKESVENTIENEIIKSDEVNSINAPRRSNFFLHDEKTVILEKIPCLHRSHTDETDCFNVHVPRHTDYKDFKKPSTSYNNNSLDLSRDTYVNKIQARKSTPVDPDVEIFDKNLMAKINESQSNRPTNSNFLNLERPSIVSRRPFDLNRDTYVNEIQARKRASMDPDAEIFVKGLLTKYK